MADIYLNHRKDKRLYASCYRLVLQQILQNLPFYCLSIYEELYVPTQLDPNTGLI